MQCLIFYLILCLVQFQVQSSDWLNRTVRVDLIVNRRAIDSQYDLLEETQAVTSGINATNGQYPWSIFTTAWAHTGSGSATGVSCSGTIIANDFVLSDLHCTGRHLPLPANSIETYIGSVQWRNPLVPTNFVRHFWYITPSLENSPNIALFRLHQSLTYTPNIRPIRLPSHENFSYEAWSSHMLGFNSPTPPSTEFLWYLQSALTSIFNNNQCNFDGNIADHEICGRIEGSLYGNISVIYFNGFTGGAWIVYEYSEDFEFHPILVGVQHYQYVNGTASFGQATRVSHFVEWIDTLSDE